MQNEASGTDDPTDDLRSGFTPPSPWISWPMDAEELILQSSTHASFKPYSIGHHIGNHLKNHSSLVAAPSATTPNPKIAIPKLVPAAKERNRRHRVVRACESCRARKVKCSGERPGCSFCKESGLTCLYKDLKLTRDRKKLERLESKTRQYETLLREIEANNEGHIGKKIQNALRNTDNPSEMDLDNDQKINTMTERDIETSDSDSVGSFKSIETLHEDLNRDKTAAPMGLYGNGLEISWTKKLDENLENTESAPLSGQSMESPAGELRQDRITLPIKDLSYHLDDQDLPLQDPVQLYILPAKRVTETYYNSYLKTVHSSFMIIREPVFTSQLTKLYDQGLKPHRTWLSVLNLILALGCRYCHTWTNVDNSKSQEFFNRARKLTMNGDLLFNHTDLQQVQVEALTALYLIEIGHIDRASRISNFALQSAIGLGINLRSEDHSLDSASKETRCRLWRALTCIENFITSSTGRVSGLNENISLVNLPKPFDQKLVRPGGSGSLIDLSKDRRLAPSILQRDEEAKETAHWLRKCAPSQSLFFHCFADLVSINQSFLSKIHSIEGLREPRAMLKERTQKYITVLDTWLTKVPEVYRFTDRHGIFDPQSIKGQHESDKSKLAINFYSVRIAFCRPCLTSPNQHPENDTSKKKNPKKGFRKQLAADCLQAACTLIRVLPDDPDLVWLALHTPRWGMTHYLMQAIAALLFGIFLSPADYKESNSPSLATPRPANEPDIRVGTVVTHLQKAISWLHCFGSVDASAARAYELCMRRVNRMAPTLNFDVIHTTSEQEVEHKGL